MKKFIQKSKLKTIIILGFSLFFIGVSSQEKPNIIFILADDLGYGDLSCYGAKDIQTPNIDKLGKDGIRFTRAYANSTVCSPSRAAILTGNYPDMVGVPGVIRDMPYNSWGNLKDDVKTLPESLKTLNYSTALIGKWHLGYKAPDLPHYRGFDFFKGYVGDMMDDYYTHQRHGINWMRENNLEIKLEGHATDLFTDWALDYIQEQKTPFFLFLAYNAPHDPVQPPNEWLIKVQRRESHLTLKRQKMIALIEHLDYSVGRILNHLKVNQLENTIIVFTSDNGGALQYGASNAPYSGGKGDMLEGGIRVPCLVKLPNQSQNEVVNTPLILMDFYPTILELAGFNKKLDLPSRPIPILTSPQEPINANRSLIWMRREGHKYGGRSYYAITDGRYKLLQNDPFSSYKLFDLLEDPLETKPINLKTKEESLFKELTKHIQTSGSIPWQ
ncbi:sulfatase-like hydrolase/transferase [Litoribaculum gwangyangense]|uniref:Sulfatase N-terminal domain-containing protein n=1 Tax=Litoribaculum gwangyangense TaxID=1130722 RepID=A0ABP9CV62_9FLAO